MTVLTTALTVLLLAACEAADSVVTLDLGGSWSLSNSSMPKPVEATVPGQVHTDLLRAGLIDEPFNGTNVELQAWVALSDWTYERTFEVPASLLAKRTVQLVSLGIDTVATLYLNSKPIHQVDNMFHRVRLNVKQHLVAGTNTLRVAFKSKVSEANARAAACDNATSIICPPHAQPAVQHGFDNVNYLRTEPCSFSWDWGPGFAPVGLWRAIYIQGYDTAVVRDVTVVTTPHTASPRLAKLQREARPDAVDGFAAHDTSDAARIARAFARTDR